MILEEKYNVFFLCIGDMISNIIYIYEFFIFKFFYGVMC